MFVPIILIKIIIAVVAMSASFYGGYCLGCNLSEKYRNER